MPEITINKFITEIKEKNVTAKLPTHAFKEITGIEDFSYLKDIEGKVVENDAILSPERDDMVYNLEEGWRVDYPWIVNGAKCTELKLLESWDLSFDMFCSAVRNASFKQRTVASYDISTYKYFICKLIHSCSFKDIRDDIYRHLNKAMLVNSTKRINRSSRISSGAVLIVRDMVDSLNDLSRYGNLAIKNHSFDGIDCKWIVEMVNQVFSICSMFHEGKEYWIPPIKEQQVHNIIQLCEEYQKMSEIKEVRVPYSMVIHRLVIGQLRGHDYGVVELIDEKGIGKLLNTRDIIPKPRILMNKQVGQYGKRKILRWNLESKKEERLKN